MARRKTKKGKYSFLSFIIIAVAAILMSLIQGEDVSDLFVGNPMTDEDEVYVHFVDVGQGSATLIQNGTDAILIDTGESEYSETLIRYINACGVRNLEYVIASHPHSDHIGGMTDIIDAYPVSRVIMPELSEINTPTTRVYEDFLSCLIEKEIETDFVTDEYALSYGLGQYIDVEILGPVEQVSDLNNMSIICRVKAFDTLFMIAGDAEKQELSYVFESPLNYGMTVIDSNNPFKSDIIAMPHHGSSTSIHRLFLDAVDADVAVISCGKNNKYGHPNDDTLEYMNESGMTVFRTDTQGDIVFKCTPDGYEVVKP